MKQKTISGGSGANMTASILSNHRKIPPYGMAGGSAAKTGNNWVQCADGYGI